MGTDPRYDKEVESETIKDSDLNLAYSWDRFRILIELGWAEL